MIGLHIPYEFKIVVKFLLHCELLCVFSRLFQPFNGNMCKTGDFPTGLVVKNPPAV